MTLESTEARREATLARIARPSLSSLPSRSAVERSTPGFGNDGSSVRTRASNREAIAPGPGDDRLVRHPEPIQRPVERLREHLERLGLLLGDVGVGQRISPPLREAELGHRLLDRQLEPAVDERLHQVADRAGVHRLHRRLHRRSAGHQDHRQIGVDHVRGAEHRDPIVSRHHHVGDDDIEGGAGHQVDRLARAGGGGDLVSAPPQQARIAAGHEDFIIDNQDRAGRTGRHGLSQCTPLAGASVWIFTPPHGYSRRRGSALTCLTDSCTDGLSSAQKRLDLRFDEDHHLERQRRPRARGQIFDWFASSGRTWSACRRSRPRSTRCRRPRRARGLLVLLARGQGLLGGRRCTSARRLSGAAGLLPSRFDHENRIACASWGT